MNFKQKLGYMFIGCLFTIAGYIIASLGGITTHAQQEKQVIDEIVCRKLKVVDDLGKTVADIDTFGMTFYDIFGERSTSINGRIIKGMSFYNKGGKIVARIGAGENGGSISVRNAAEKEVVGIFTTKDGNGCMVIYNAAGKDLVAIGSIEGRPNDGLINVYNHKGEWRSISKD